MTYYYEEALNKFNGLPSHCHHCAIMDEFNNHIHMENIKYYEDSSFSYCKKCYEKTKQIDCSKCNKKLPHKCPNEDLILCELCNKNIQGFICENNNDHLYICYKCKCNGEKCEYC